MPFLLLRFSFHHLAFFFGAEKQLPMSTLVCESHMLCVFLGRFSREIRLCMVVQFVSFLHFPQILGANCSLIRKE